MRLDRFWIWSNLYDLMQLAAKRKLLHMVLLSVLLMQMTAHATPLHHEMMGGGATANLMHTAQHQHENGTPVHFHVSPCVFASSAMLLCVFPFIAAGIVPIGQVVLQIFFCWPSIFRVPIPPPKSSLTFPLC